MLAVSAIAAGTCDDHHLIPGDEHLAHERLVLQTRTRMVLSLRPSNLSGPSLVSLVCVAETALCSGTGLGISRTLHYTSFVLYGPFFGCAQKTDPNKLAFPGWARYYSTMKTSPTQEVLAKKLLTYARIVVSILYARERLCDQDSFYLLNTAS